jgi:DNA-binding response OmpR family regulator
VENPDTTEGPVPRIVFVDDDVDTTTVFRVWCKKWGFVSRAEDLPARALQTILDFGPDVIFLDVQMPGTNGFEVLEQVRQHPRTCDIPVVMLTGDAIHPAERARGLGTGALDYLTKPISSRDMLAAIKNGLNILSIRRDAKQTLTLEGQTVREALNFLGEGRGSLEAMARLLEAVRFDPGDEQATTRRDLLTRCTSSLQGVLGTLRDLERHLGTAYPELESARQSQTELEPDFAGPTGGPAAGFGGPKG